MNKMDKELKSILLGYNVKELVDIHLGCIQAERKKGKQFNKKMSKLKKENEVLEKALDESCLEVNLLIDCPSCPIVENCPKSETEISEIACPKHLKNHYIQKARKK